MPDTFSKLSQDLSRIKTEFVDNLSGIRSNRANPGMVDSIEVEVYGSKMKIRDLAHIAAPDARLLVVQPWDATQVEVIAKGLAAAGLGVTPVVDSGVIRLPLPPLTEERRLELIKLVKSRLEDARVATRQARHTAMEYLERQKKDGEINEDDVKRGESQIQKEVTSVTAYLEGLSDAKEAELRAI